MMVKIIIVGIAAAIGALLRYEVIELVGTRFGWTDFPVATIVINVSGAFMLGYLAAHLTPTGIPFLIGSGIMGGYTTFSTYINETIRLKIKNGPLAIVYFIGTSLLGIIAALVGMAI